VRESATVTATEALELGVIDLIAETIPELLLKLDGFALRDGRVLSVAGLPLREIHMTFREQLFSYLADPNLVYILLMLGLYGLIYEFLTPGIGLGFVVGSISLLLAIFGLQLLPISFVGVGLVLLGFALIVLEVFATSHGLLTLGGVASLVLGSLSLFEVESPAVRLSWTTVAATLGDAYFPFALHFGQGACSPAPSAPPPSRLWWALKARRATIWHRRAGSSCGGEYWWARAEDGPIARGERVEVIGQEGRRLRVRRIEPR